MSLSSLISRRTLAYVSAGSFLAAGGSYWYLTSGGTPPRLRGPPPPWIPPTRQQMLERLKSGEEFDLLVVGGGATGAGVAVDAASRGLKVALVERDDFSSGTSSKSTKLVHGGVRYLEKAFMELDYGQYKLVREALHERKVFLQTAPYLSSMLPIVMPIYQAWRAPYIWVGCKVYDFLAGKSENPNSSYFMTKGQALEVFPTLKADKLLCGLVFYDGQHNDSRMNIALIMSAVRQGAAVANYCSLTSVSGTPRVRDHLTGEEWEVKARGVINATGPLTDNLLALVDPDHKPIVAPSSGTHITLPSYYAPQVPKMGLIDSSSDGRVVFVLPWEGGVLAGTTDTPISLQANAEGTVGPKEEEIDFILGEVKRCLGGNIDVRREDVLSAWTGVRPLVRDPRKSKEGGKTEGLVRSHIVFVSKTPDEKGPGMLTVAGGKWTTYREMAEETVNEAVKAFSLTAEGCKTKTLKLVGADTWTPALWIGLLQAYDGLPVDVAKHLAGNYGDRAWEICDMAVKGKFGWKRLDDKYSYLEAEVPFAVRNEFALSPIDVVARRTRLAFLDSRAAYQALPRVVEIMSAELGWGSSKRKEETKKAVAFLKNSMGLGLLAGTAGATSEKAMHVAVERSGGSV